MQTSRKFNCNFSSVLMKHDQIKVNSHCITVTVPCVCTHVSNRVIRLIVQDTFLLWFMNTAQCTSSPLYPTPVVCNLFTPYQLPKDKHWPVQPPLSLQIEPMAHYLVLLLVVKYSLQQWKEHTHSLGPSLFTNCLQYPDAWSHNSLYKTYM